MLMNPLQKRLAALRRRLRLIVTFRGLCWLGAALLAPAALAGLADWLVHLPGLVRAGLLVGILSLGGTLAYLLLIRPLAARADDLSLALRLEWHYPFLKDSLASAVQFLEQGSQAEGTGGESSSLRQAAVEAARGQVRRLDFNRLVDSRGVGAAGCTLVGTALMALALALLNPPAARTALARLAFPFSGRDWPQQTELTLTFNERVARGEPFEIHGQLAGVIPASAVVHYDGITPARQNCPVRRDKGTSAGSLLIRLDRVERNFRFQVSANDAVSAWHHVRVPPPPLLVPLNGRPSPQVRLRYPAYTDLLAQDLPDGTGNVEAIAGTEVTFRAAVDRPLARAWIAYRPEQPLVKHASFLGFLGAQHPAGVLALAAAGQEVWARIPVRLEANRRVLSVTFRPRIRGMYALCMEDETGLGNTRFFDLRLLADPAPVVNLERPSQSHDSLNLLPEAEIAVQVRVEDQQYALRSVYLLCRWNDPAALSPFTGRATPPNSPDIGGEQQTPSPSSGRAGVESASRIPLYDHQSLGTVLPQVLAGLTGSPIPMPALSLRLRPQRLLIARRLSLSAITWSNRGTLQEGDVIKIQAFADDFDDVAVDKLPGKSHEIELRIIGKPALEALLNRAQTEVQEELLRLRKQQQEALDHVIGAAERWRNTGRLRPQEVDRLLQAEQLQQQIRARVGTRQEGLRADVAKILQMLRDNLLPRSGTHDRMEVVAAELDRLAREELEQIEPNLTNARKENETASVRPAADDKKAPLGEARKHQEEVENTLNDLLKLLEPWGDVRTVRGETRAILQEQQKLQKEVDKINPADSLGRERDRLTPEQRAERDAAAENQKKLAERADQLLGKIQRASESRQEKDPELAQALREAAEKGREGTVAENMRSAARNIQDNQLHKAGDEQKASAQALAAMIQALEERREQELQQMRKKLKAAQDELAKLTHEQEELRKKVKKAQGISDSQQREAELKRLAREQEKLRQKAQDLGRELAQLRADRAGQALGDAGDKMEQAGQQLDQGDNPDDPQEDALQRLNEAQRRLDQNQEEVEDELAREKLFKIADQLKLLKGRQESAVEEARRIQERVVQNQKWDRTALTNLVKLADDQKNLAGDTRSLAEEKLAPAQVFARILSKAADAMQAAAQRMEQQRENVRSAAPAPDEEANRLQQEAVRRLAQLLDAVKSERAMAQRAPGDEKGGKATAGKRSADGISKIAQLRALRALQQEVNERTERLGLRHPNPEKLAGAAQLELSAIRKDQQEIADLLDELLAPPAEEEGGKK